MNVLVRPWESIEAHYESVASRSAGGAHMVGLVRAIRQSSYSCGLYAWTSVLDLCIVQTPVDYPYAGPHLRISPQQGGTLDFRYLDTPDATKQWRRLVPGEAGFATLQQFLGQLGWFAGEARGTGA